MSKTTLVTTLMPLVIALTTAFPNGARNNVSNPLDSMSSYCTAGNFRPNHGDNLPQATPPPFKITVVSPAGNIYQPGRTVTVTLEPRSTAARVPMARIKGFFLQGDNTESSFGGDLVCNPEHGQKVTFCGKTGVTHTNAIPKVKVVCQWTPPDFQIGKVQFVASVVENFTHFWTGVKSSDLLLPDPKTMTFNQKSKLLMTKMMGQLQSQGQGQNVPNFMNLMSKQLQGNPLLNFFGGSADANSNQNTNPFAGLMSMAQGSNGAKSNPFASLMPGAHTSTAQHNPFASVVGQSFGLGGGKEEETNAWARAGGLQTQSRGFHNFDSNTEARMANLPSAFQSFFQQ